MTVPPLTLHPSVLARRHTVEPPHCTTPREQRDRHATSLTPSPRRRPAPQPPRWPSPNRTRRTNWPHPRDVDPHDRPRHAFAYSPAGELPAAAPPGHAAHSCNRPQAPASTATVSNAQRTTKRSLTSG